MRISSFVPLSSSARADDNPDVKKQIKQLATEGPAYLAPVARMMRPTKRSEHIALVKAIRSNNVPVRDELLLRTAPPPLDPTERFRETRFRQGLPYTSAVDVATEEGVDPSHLKMMLDHGLVDKHEHERPPQSRSKYILPHNTDGRLLSWSANHNNNEAVGAMLKDWVPPVITNEARTGDVSEVAAVEGDSAGRSK